MAIHRRQLFMEKAKIASKEGLVVAIGDFNLDLNRFEDPTYYKKELAEKAFQAMQK